MSELYRLLDAIIADPLAEGFWSVVADWLEECDGPRRAELLRLHRRLLETCLEPDAHPERQDWQSRVVELLGEGVRACVPQRSVTLAEGVEMAFSFIPHGSFLMGSPEGEEGRQDREARPRVTLTRGFWLGVHPVTQAQWHAVKGRSPGEFEGDDQPVERVSWDDCQRLVGELARRAGPRFRLPTEAEWEHACRAGTTTAFFFGDTAPVDRANYDGSYVDGGGVGGVYRERTTPAGNFPPNAWGLCDTHGNVSEWCEDRAAAYPSGEACDPRGGEHGHARLVRGGSWNDEPRLCRSACRIAYLPGYGDDCFGCRVLMCLD